jgi:diguanylate cyclase (GGDEF)-like protein
MRCVLLLLLHWLAGPAALAQPERSAHEQAIVVLENLGRGQPAVAAARLEALMHQLPEGSAERLEALTVQGLMFANASQVQPAEGPAAALDLWARTPALALARGAAAAALLIRATSAARGGNDMRLADALLTKAMAERPKDQPPREAYRYLLVHADVKTNSGAFEDAVRLGYQALALADRDAEPWRQSEARTGLATSYYGARQLERARSIAQEAVALAERVDDPVSLARAHNALGIALDMMGDTQAERRAWEFAIACALRAGSKIDEVRYRANLADFFLKQGDYKTALAHAERALPLARELKDTNSEMVSLANMGLAHISLQHFEIGKRLVGEAIAIEEGRGATSGMADTYEELGTYLERAGDPAGAIAAYHRHRKLRTTLLRDDQQKAILAMQEQHDADSRARALQVLNAERQVKAEQIRRRDLQQSLWGLLAVASLLLFIVVVLLLRRVRQTNRLLLSSSAQLQLQSERDPLTGLANRRHFQAAMRRLAPDGLLDGSVFLIDLDRFKQINDRHGHRIGDAVLVEAARRLRETLREEDLIVRWGGEEFLVVVRRLAADDVELLAERMLRALGQTPVRAGDVRLAVTASLGFATFPIGDAKLAVRWERAVNLVDAAMYLAKAHGRNRAYGVRTVDAADVAALERIAEDLPAAVHDGRARLSVLHGRVPLTLQVAA